MHFPLGLMQDLFDPGVGIMGINKFLACLRTLGVLWIAAGVGFSAHDGDKPNFVFFLVDDLGWKDLGCYGSSAYETPSVDRLAASGMRFTDAYAACPVCSPTRASIMTGKYPTRVGITDWIPGDNPRNRKLIQPEDLHQLPLEEVTIAEALREA
ncbi:MAG: sulfatase-like hydrolase/transferase, partial [Acidobacteriota bacterium]